MIHNLYDTNERRDRLPWLAFLSSKELSQARDPRCWYAQLILWISLDSLPLFQYNLDEPNLNLPLRQINQLIRSDILQAYTRKKWMHEALSMKLCYCEGPFSIRDFLTSISL